MSGAKVVAVDGANRGVTKLNALVSPRHELQGEMR
jgi:hypothetical protein